MKRPGLVPAAGLVLGGLSVLAVTAAVRRRRRPHLTSQPEEIVDGVHCLALGARLTRANVYFVASSPSWVLIDAAWIHDGQQIKQGAEAVFGPGTRPAAILLTHIHPDHSGAARELARLWNVPVYVHPSEMPLVPGRLVPQYSNPLDRRLIGPLMRLMPRPMVDSMVDDASLVDVARAFDPAAGLPGLPEWQCIPTPGHTPGHVSFYRKRDGVLIAGDAALMVNVNSVWDLVRNTRRVSGPPYISTWNWPLAKASVRVLADLEPTVLACGHGAALSGPTTARDLRAFADRFQGCSLTP